MGNHEDANLILKLYELRREDVMRRARDWMATFNPNTAQDIIDAVSGQHSAYFRMVMSYWDMAAALVNHGAINEELFHDTNGEHLYCYAKIEPFVAELREKFGPQIYPNLEKLVLRQPNIQERLAHLRQMSKNMAARRDAAAAAEATT